MSIFSREDGSNLLLLNTVYVKPHPKDDGSGKWTQGTLYLTYRDLDTNQKFVEEIVDPKTHTYITKSEHRRDFNTQRSFIEEDRVDEHQVPYRFISKYIRDEIQRDGVDLGYVKLYDEAIREGRGRLKKEVFKWRHAYYSDYDISDYAQTHAFLKFNPEKMYITKAYMDIETDIYGRTASEHDGGECPINAISYVIDHEPDGRPTKRPYVFTFLLRDHARYSQQAQFEENLDEFYKKCEKEFTPKYGKLKFKIKVFDDEIELLRTFFALFHMNKSDFIHVWNMSYDVPYITKRLQYLGYNPIDFFSHPDFKDSYMYYYVDSFYKNDFPNRVDYFDSTSYTRWTDQMLNYAGIRKAKSDYGGVGLDNVSKLELNAEKRVYDGIGVDVINGAICEYENFVLYSINDTLLQLGLDRKTDDTQTLFEQAYTGGTRITKVLKQSVYLKNVYAIEFFKMNLVMKNNTNIDYSGRENLEEDDTYDDVELSGALVGNPELNAENGIIIFGKPSKYAFELLIDFDFASMYP